MTRYVAAIDQGTTSTRFMVFDRAGAVYANEELVVQNDLLMQFQADILDVPVIRPTISETTSLGAAFLAGLAVGYWSAAYELREDWGRDFEWSPAISAPERERSYRQWKKAVRCTFNWLEPDEESQGSNLPIVAGRE